MATDGSARYAQCMPRGWHSAALRPSVLATRLLLLVAGCVLAWVGLAALTAAPASGAEPGDSATHEESGLLGTSLLDGATDTVSSLTGSAVTDAEEQRTDRSATADDGRAETDTDEGDGDDAGRVLGSLADSAKTSPEQSLTPVRTLVADGFEQPSTPIQPVLLTAHQAGQHVLGEVATEVGPITRSVPLSAGVPAALDTAPADADSAAPATQPLTAASTGSPHRATDTMRAGADGTGAGASQATGDTTRATNSTPADAADLPVRSDGDRDGLPAGSPQAPVGTTSSTSQLGNGSGSAGSYAYAEPVRMLAAWFPSAVVPTTDADISSGDDERPSVSPD